VISEDTSKRKMAGADHADDLISIFYNLHCIGTLNDIRSFLCFVFLLLSISKTPS